MNSESVNCEYSRMVLEAARTSFIAINFVETEEEKQKHFMDQYYAFDFKEQYSKYVGLILENIAKKFAG